MKLPSLSSLLACVSQPDLRRSLEAMLVGLRCDPPDAFVEDWKETIEELERILVEMERREFPVPGGKFNDSKGESRGRAAGGVSRWGRRNAGTTAGFPQSATSAVDYPHNFDWARLVAQTVHPLKVAIIEALVWIGEPLSREDLADVLAETAYDLEAIRYHANGLESLGTIEVTRVQPVRGGLKRFYFLASPEEARDTG